MKAVIIMGSKSDMEYGKKIAERLKFFGIEAVLRIASAHKTPEKALKILREYEDDDVVFVTIAGRSNALSGFADANTFRPVIASPPISDKFAGMDILSSINMPSGVAPMLVIYAENTALAVAKIFALKSREVAEKVREYQRKKKEEIERADEEAKSI
ncbi:AIR carboxylase family protein [Geoglobus acetivorans]|uniref:Phosphoribosylaminoimidazole carboxylase n=1 Tax=Geoglobus acetivorans TaxID=565033 RepID=A0A0A7GF97_GEOAI|nr:Phosphoribosylaminoimidazole carboxylase catalytic subunit [Geoglobus acetivorans]